MKSETKEKIKRNLLWVSLLVAAFLATASFLTWATVRVVKAVNFSINLDSYIDRASGSADVETAREEIGKAIAFLEKKGLTEGICKIYIEDPRDDIGFFYTNLKNIYNELGTLGNSSQFEKSTYLLRMKESLEEVGTPEGISIYPKNLFYNWWAWGSLIGAILLYSFSYMAYLTHCVALHKDSDYYYDY